MQTFKSFLNDRKALLGGKEWEVTKLASEMDDMIRPVDKVTASQKIAPDEKMKVLKNIKGSLSKK